MSLEPVNYSFRSLTLAAKVERENKLSPSKGSRIKLTPTKTASIFVKENHDCSTVDVDSTVIKVTARFFFSMFRFAMAYAWGCNTIRGATRFNGDRSSCGCCQAAHAALCPTLYDNYLEKVIQSVKEVGYEELKSQYRDYLEKRFVLNEEERRDLSSESELFRYQAMGKIVKRLERRELKGTFVGTPVDFARNATYENPSASNRIDCHLESSLRSLEDRLAEDCTNSSKNLKEALKELFEVHRNLLLDLENRLVLNRDRFCSLQTLWEQFVSRGSEIFPFNVDLCLKSFDDTSSDFQESFEGYLCSMEKYLDDFERFFSGAHKGVPKLERLKENLKQGRPVKVLKKMVKDKQNPSEAYGLYLQNERHLAPINGDLENQIRVDFNKGIEEIDKRIAEVQAQLVIVNRDFDELHELMKIFWGVKNEEGQFFTPTKEDLVKGLHEHVVSVTPTRSDLKRNTRNRSPLAFSFKSDSPMNESSSSSSELLSGPSGKSFCRKRLYDDKENEVFFQYDSGEVNGML